MHSKLLARFYPSDDRGVVAIIVAISAIALFGIGALAVDLGNMYAQRRSSQLTADLAALAGGQGLTDATRARCLAKQYVEKNLVGTDAYPTGSDWDYDGDLNNGEIQIFDASGDEIPGGPSTPGCVSAGGTSAIKLKVIIPRRAVQFGLAGVLGFSRSSVNASATVTLRTPAGITLPFGLSVSAASAGLVCLKSGSASISDPDCAGGTTGNYGTLDIPRTVASQNSKQVDYNIKYGADHGLKKYSGAVAPNQTCANTGNGSPTMPGAIADDNPPYPDSALPNCILTEPGVADQQDAFIDGKFDGTNKGRLAPAPTGHSTGTIAGRTDVDNDSFLHYLIGSPNPLNLTSANQIDQSIINCPRFGIVPVFNVTAFGPGKKYFPIVGFRAVYIEKIYTNHDPDESTGSVKALKVYVFDPNLITSIVPNDPGSSPFIGYGPRSVALVD